jgi:DNA invertase Pin-like site-specific DNA recombinase
MPRNKSYAQEAVRQRIGRPIDEALRDLYIDRRHSQQEIADALGVSRMTVSVWLREFGITRDDRPAVAL